MTNKKFPNTHEELLTYGLREKDIEDWNAGKFTDEFKSAYVKLVDYAKKKFKVSINITSGYRSLQEQIYVYNLYGSQRAAIPGTSKHETGHAVDISITGYDTGNPNDPVIKALGQYWESLGYTWGAKFDFCEPWHFEIS